MTATHQSTRSRAPRTHAERTAETRGRIMAAVVESIGAVGFQHTTAAEIARRAGVTWGAVQHHFGGKDGILEAVLESSFDRFAERLADVPVERTGIEERVSLFVDRAWGHFGSAHYRSTFEILLHYAGPAGPDPELLWQSEMFAAWKRTWSGLFADARLPRRRDVALQLYTIAVLSGLATMKMLAGTNAPIRRTELGLLKDTLTRELAQRS